MSAIFPLEHERRAGQFGTINRTAAVDTLLEDGFVLLRSVVGPDHIAALRTRMEADLERIRSLPNSPDNFTKGHLQQAPPPEPQFLFRDIIANPFATQIVQQILGSGAKLVTYTGNTNLPGTKPQPVHPDFQQLWPNLSMAHPGYGYIINVPLVDVTPHNGAIELWPGTHRDTGASISDTNIRLGEKDLSRWRAARPPIQPSTQIGDLIVRDCRLWHRGMPNHSDVPRPMVAMIVWAPWYATTESLTMPRSAEAFFRASPLSAVVRYTDESIDHIGRLSAFDVRDDAEAVTT